MNRSTILRTSRPTKPPRCKACRQTFEKTRPGQLVCDEACGLEFARLKREKAERVKAKAVRASDRERKEKLKTRSDWLREAQTAFNAWVRERDRDEPCISCQRHHQGAYDAGHYRSRGAMSALRFHPDNCHKQCVPCNQHKSGNIVEYRINLVRKIGTARVNFLEGDHEPEKWAIEEIKAIRDLYREKVRRMRG